MFEDPTLAAGSGLILLPPATVPIYLSTFVAPGLQSQLGDCSSARAPGRPTRESSIFSFFVPRRGSRGDEGSGEKCREEEEDRLSPAVGSFTHPSLPLLFFSPWLPAFSWTCVLTQMCIRVHTITHVHTRTHKHTYSISPFFCVVTLSDRLTKTRCFWRGWPSLQSILLAQRQ